jgi:hypothetical protein
MTDDAARQRFQAMAGDLREDQAAADQLHGAMETLIEKVPADAIVKDTLARCVAFRRLLREVNRFAPAGETPDAAKLGPALDDWQKARAAFNSHARQHKEYLEKLALRIYR